MAVASGDSGPDGCEREQREQQVRRPAHDDVRVEGHQHEDHDHAGQRSDRRRTRPRRGPRQRQQGFDVIGQHVAVHAHAVGTCRLIAAAISGVSWGHEFVELGSHDGHCRVVPPGWLVDWLPYSLRSLAT
jgi:hypothetical protein